MPSETATTYKPLIGMDLAELEAYVLSLGLEKFRAKQIFKWIYSKSERDPTKMTDLSPKARELLAANPIGSLSIAKHQISQDGTQKFLFSTLHGDTVESVFMPMGERGTTALGLDQGIGERSTGVYSNVNEDAERTNNADISQANKSRITACISSQVGCAVKCPFCATGTVGFKRNLSADEIIEQVLLMQHVTGERIDNLVFMGQGEPLNNYDNVVESINKFRHLVGIGVRHITVSTSGVVPAMLKLAEEGMQVNLALSLHDPDDADRDYLVPINKKWPVKEVIAALQNYVDKTNRRVTIEYAMLRDRNDSQAKAESLGKLVAKLHCNINLIPYNTTDVTDPFQRSSDAVIRAFAQTLEIASRNKTVTTRRERGHDIDAACGQLANK